MALSTEDLKAISDMIAAATSPATPPPVVDPLTPAPITLDAIQQMFTTATQAQQDTATAAQAAQTKVVMDKLFAQTLSTALETTPHLKDVLEALDPVFGVSPMSRINEIADFDERTTALNKVIENTNQAAASSGAPLPIVTQRQQEQEVATDAKYASADQKILKDNDLTAGVESTFNQLMDDLTASAVVN